MTASSKLKLTIQFTDPKLKAEERNEEAQSLIDQLSLLKDRGEIDRVSRVIDPTPSSKNDMDFGACLVGVLMAQITIDNAIKVLEFLLKQLVKKVNKGIIEITVEVDGEKYTVKVSSRQELDYAFQAIEKFIAAKASKNVIAA
jgi:ribosome-associated translation inhibitor RaiA